MITGNHKAGSQDNAVAKDCTTEHVDVFGDVFGDATGHSQVYDFPYRRDFVEWCCQLKIKVFLSLHENWKEFAI